MGIETDWNCAISLRPLEDSTQPDPHRMTSSYADWDVKVLTICSVYFFYILTLSAVYRVRETGNYKSQYLYMNNVPFLAWCRLGFHTGLRLYGITSSGWTTYRFWFLSLRMQRPPPPKTCLAFTKRTTNRYSRWVCLIGENSCTSSTCAGYA